MLVDDIGTECVEYDCKRFGILAQDKNFDGSLEASSFLVVLADGVSLSM